MKPEISIVLTTYRRGNNGLLKRAIDSVLLQTYEDFELIVLDDGSTDQTQQLLWSYTDPRIRIVRHQENSGLHAKRLNEGIRLAKGQYIAFQFDDDFWLPQHLELLLKEIRRLGEVYGMVFGWTLCLHAVTQEISLLGQDYSPERILGGNCIGNQSVLMRKSVLLDVGGYDEDRGMVRFCDWDLWVRVVKRGYKIAPVPLVTSINHYAHPDSLRETVPFDFNYILARMQQNRIVYLRSLVARPQKVSKDGYLLKGQDGPGVYWVANGLKHLLPSEEIFRQLGFQWSDVRIALQSEVNQIPDGVVLTPDVF